MGSQAGSARGFLNIQLTLDSPGRNLGFSFLPTRQGLTLVPYRASPAGGAARPPGRDHIVGSDIVRSSPEELKAGPSSGSDSRSRPPERCKIVWRQNRFWPKWSRSFNSQADRSEQDQTPGISMLES